MMDSDSDISKIRGLVESFSNASTTAAKKDLLGKISSAVDIAFATAEVRDEITTFLTRVLIGDKVLFAVDATNLVDGRLVALNLVRKLQTKNFLRRLDGCEWSAVLAELVMPALRTSTREDVWFSAVSVCSSAEATVRAALLPSPSDIAAFQLKQFSDLFVHPIPVARLSLLRSSESVCRQTLNLLSQVVQAMEAMEEEESLASLAPRSLEVVRFALLCVAAFCGHNSELCRWSLLQTLEQLEGRLVGSAQLKPALMKDCNIEKIGKEMQLQLRAAPIQTLRLWRVLVRLLDKCILTSSCFNALAPVISDSLHKMSDSVKVQLLTQDAWKDLVDVFTHYPGSRESYSRMCLLLRVYRRIYTQDVVQMRRLHGWWHFITRLTKGMLLQLYETALTPFLAYLLGRFPVSLEVTNEAAEKQFGYRLSSLHAESSAECLHFASHVMAELWLRREDGEEGEDLRREVLLAVKPKLTAETPSILTPVASWEEFLNKGLPAELVSRKPVLGARMLNFVIRWLGLWREQATANKTDPNGTLCLWILSRVLRKWLALVDEAVAAPSVSANLAHQLVGQMVTIFADACAQFHLTMEHRVESISTMLARPEVKRALLDHQPNFQMVFGRPEEWNPYRLFCCLLPEKDEKDKVVASLISSSSWWTVLSDLLRIMLSLPLVSLEFFSSLSGHLIQLRRHLAATSSPDDSASAALLNLWLLTTTRLTQFVKEHHEVASSTDTALRPRLTPFHFAFRFPFDLAPSSADATAVSNVLSDLYAVFCPEALLLPSLAANAWCPKIARSLQQFAKKPPASLLPTAVAFTISMLERAEAVKEDVENNSPPPSDSSDSLEEEEEEGESREEGPKKWQRALLESPHLRMPSRRSATGHSPAGQWSLARRRPLGALTSTFDALLSLIQWLPGIGGGKEETTEVKKEMVGMLETVTNCLRTLLLEKVTRPSTLLALVERCGSPVGGLLERCAALPLRSLKPTLKQRLETLPIDLLDRIRSICPGPFDSQLLARVAPLMMSVCRLQPGMGDRAALSTPKRRAAKVLMNGLVAFWNATFAECSNLSYPEHLLEYLAQLKNRYRLSLFLPGGASVEPSMQNSLLDSEAPSTPTEQPLVAPMTPVGSFLHRSSPGRPSPPAPTASVTAAASPARAAAISASASPVRSASVTASASPVRSARLAGRPTVRKRALPEPALNADSESSEKFVFIPAAASTRINKRIHLTEHQKERMAELKSCAFVPAMYNELDNSQQSQPAITPSQDSNSQFTNPMLSSQSLMERRRKAALEAAVETKKKEEGAEKEKEKKEEEVQKEKEEKRKQETKKEEKRIEEEAKEKEKKRKEEEEKRKEAEEREKEKKRKEEDAEKEKEKKRKEEEAEKEKEKKRKEEAEKEKKKDEKTVKEKRNDEKEEKQQHEEEETEHVFLVEASQSPPPLARRIGLSATDFPSLCQFTVEETDEPEIPVQRREESEGPEKETEESEKKKEEEKKEEEAERTAPVLKLVLADNHRKPSAVKLTLDPAPENRVVADPEADTQLLGDNTQASESPSTEAGTAAIPCGLPSGCSTPDSISKAASHRPRPTTCESSRPRVPRQSSLPTGPVPPGSAPLPRTLPLSSSRGAKMVALAQAKQAAKRERARLERESNASDTSFSSVGSRSSPPGIIRTFFTPSKGHRVSFAEPLVLRWDGCGGPPSSSTSLLAIRGSPALEEELDGTPGTPPSSRRGELPCRKSLLADFEALEDFGAEEEKRMREEKADSSAPPAKRRRVEEEAEDVEEDTQPIPIPLARFEDTQDTGPTIAVTESEEESPDLLEDPCVLLEGSAEQPITIPETEEMAMETEEGVESEEMGSGEAQESQWTVEDTQQSSKAVAGSVIASDCSPNVSDAQEPAKSSEGSAEDVMDTQESAKAVRGSGSVSSGSSESVLDTQLSSKAIKGTGSTSEGSSEDVLDTQESSKEIRGSESTSEGSSGVIMDSQESPKEVRATGRASEGFSEEVMDTHLSSKAVRATGSTTEGSSEEVMDTQLSSKAVRATGSTTEGSSEEFTVTQLSTTAVKEGTEVVSRHVPDTKESSQTAEALGSVAGSCPEDTPSKAAEKRRWINVTLESDDSLEDDEVPNEPVAQENAQRTSESSDLPWIIMDPLRALREVSADLPQSQQLALARELSGLLQNCLQQLR